MAQWSRPHQDKSPERLLLSCEYADTSAGTRGDLLLWALEGPPGFSDKTGTPIPDIYGAESTILTGIRAIRANRSNPTNASLVAAGVLDHDTPAVGLATLNTRIHKLVSIVAWGPAIAKVDIATTGATYTPLVAATGGAAGTGDGALEDIDLASGTPLDARRVCAFLSQAVTPPYQGLARVWVACLK